MVALIGLFIYLAAAGGYALAYKFHMGAGTVGGMWYKDRPDWIPQSWLDWAGNPGTFSKLVNMEAPTSAVYEIITGVTNVNTCKLKCDKKNSDQASQHAGGLNTNRLQRNATWHRLSILSSLGPTSYTCTGRPNIHRVPRRSIRARAITSR